jgi:hypothetical protein
MGQRISLVKYRAGRPPIIYGTGHEYSQWIQRRNTNPRDTEKDTLRAARYRAAKPPIKYTGKEHQPLDKVQEYYQNAGVK